MAVNPTEEVCVVRHIGDLKGPWCAITLVAGEGPERLQDLLGPLLSPWWRFPESTVDPSHVRMFRRTLSTWAQRYYGVLTTTPTHNRTVQSLAHWIRLTEATARRRPSRGGEPHHDRVQRDSSGWGVPAPGGTIPHPPREFWATSRRGVVAPCDPFSRVKEDPLRQRPSETGTPLPERR